MYKYFFAFLIFPCLSGYSVFSQEIQYFDGNNQYVFDSVLYQSSVEQKPVFLFVHSIYCGVCAELEEKTLNNPSIIKTLNQSYLSIKTDLESEAGALQVNLYGIQNIPTILVLNWKGQTLEMIRGLMKTDDLAGMLAKYARWRDKLVELNDKCVESVCNKQEIAQRALIMSYLGFYPEGKKLAKEYFTKFGYQELFEDEWELLTTYFFEPTDSPLVYFLSHITDFRDIYGNRSVDAFLQKLFEYNYKTAVAKVSEPGLDFSLGLIDYFSVPDGGAVLLLRMKEYYKLKFFSETKNWKNYSSQALKYLSNYTTEEEETREILMNIYLHAADTKIVKQAREIASALEKKNPSFENKIMLAFLEQRLGRYKQAFAILDKARALAGSNDELKTLEKIRKEFEKAQKN